MNYISLPEFGLYMLMILVVFGWKGIGMLEAAKLAEAEYAISITETPSEHTNVELALFRCGKYDLDYWEADNGFWNCKER